MSGKWAHLTCRVTNQFYFDVWTSHRQHQERFPSFLRFVSVPLSRLGVTQTGSMLLGLHKAQLQTLNGRYGAPPDSLRLATVDMIADAYLLVVGIWILASCWFGWVPSDIFPFLSAEAKIAVQFVLLVQTRRARSQPILDVTPDGYRTRTHPLGWGENCSAVAPIGSARFGHRPTGIQPLYRTFYWRMDSRSGHKVRAIPKHWELTRNLQSSQIHVLRQRLKLQCLLWDFA